MPSEEQSPHFGPYRLLHQIGAGGMGQVFLATQAGEHGIRRLVAVKRILSHLTSSPKLVQLFLDEVRIASQINHGNIVQVLDHGSVDGRYYMAMEYVHGENLAEIYERLLPKGKRLALDLLLAIVSEVCQGLDHAHRKVGLDGKPLGIVHRDISPHNVMISFQGEVKVADFGVARATEQTHETLGGELRGKVGYMSPEQAYGKDLDARSDLFSLGLVLYEGLAGKNPVARKNLLATLEAVRAVEIAPIGEVRPDLPLELTELVDSALCPDPERRPDSARSFYEALQRIMRVNNMAVSAFDLADYMGELFPASAAYDAEPPEATQPGRRADEVSPPTEDQQIKDTLFYLRQRHPDGDLTLPPLDEGSIEGPAGEAVASLPSSSARVGRRALLLLLLLLVAAGGIGLALVSWQKQPKRAAIGADAALVKRQAPDVGTVSAAPPVDAAAPRMQDFRIAAARATLRVKSVPAGATVMLGGRALGQAPLRRVLAPGRYQLTLKAPYHESHHESLTLTAGKAMILKRRLTPLPVELNIISRPPCQLKIDGKSAGKTPQRRKLRPRAIRISCAYRGAVIKRKVALRPGPRHELRLGFGTLDINVQPWARVAIDGRPRGETPLSVKLAEGTHRLRLENPQKGRTRDKTVEVRAGFTTRISSW